MVATGEGWELREEWRQVGGSTLHEVSSQGRIRSWAVPGFWGRVAKAPRLLKGNKGRDGYIRVSLGRGRREHIHTLVATAFHGPRGTAECCRHLNGDPADNRASNLAWGTTQENVDDTHRHGRVPVGERHHGAKLTEASVREIRASTESVSALSRRFGIARKNVRMIRERKTWAHVE